MTTLADSVAITVAPASREPLLTPQPQVRHQTPAPYTLFYLPKFALQLQEPGLPWRQIKADYQPTISCHRRFSLVFFSALSVAAIALSIFNMFNSTLPHDKKLEKYLPEIVSAASIVLKEMIDIKCFRVIISRPDPRLTIIETSSLKGFNFVLGIFAAVVGISDRNYPLAVSGVLYCSSYVVTYNCTIRAWAKIMKCAQGMCGGRSVAEGT